jgi:hypothetical protein
VREEGPGVAKATNWYPAGLPPDRLRLLPPEESMLQPEEQLNTCVLLGALVALQLGLTTIHAIYQARRRSKQLRHHRTLAARRALYRLRQLSPADVELVGNLAFDFLRNRFELGGNVPSWPEIEEALLTAATPPDQIALARDFYDRWNAARFGPPAANSDSELTAAARSIIQALDVM